MADLVAQGPGPGHYWRKTLPAEAVILGRVQKCDWEAPWDEHISRRHVRLEWQQGKLHVVHLSEGRNPVFYNGQQCTEFDLEVGECFVIGKTRFTLEESEVSPGEAKILELTCSKQELDQVRYGDAADRLEALARLPAMLRFTPSDRDFHQQVLQVLLDGIPRAEAAALVWLEVTSAAGPVVHVRQALGRDGRPSTVQPSRRLVLETLRRRRQPVLHAWSGGQAGDFTAPSEFAWALCTPLPDEPLPGYALYASGRSRSETARKEDLKFAGLLAEIVGQLLQVRDLQKRRRLMESFLSPRVLAHLAGQTLDQDMDQLIRPELTNLTVLFCDLRGFSRRAEAEQDLRAFCDRVSEALNVMAEHIIDQEGVVGDFQGDAAMGFWGWPEPSDDQVARAASAALGILKKFQQCHRKRDHPLADFQCGIGIAHGPGIAGRLGAYVQFKVGAFGPPVNVAARLESLTKVVGGHILVDENAALKLAGRPRTSLRLRRLARVQPYGMNRALMLHELLPPAHEPDAMPERDLLDYEAGLDNFLSGRWDIALHLLERLPHDKPSRFLRDFMLQHHNPPQPWEGVLVMDKK